MKRIGINTIAGSLIFLVCSYTTWAQKPEVKAIDKVNGGMAEVVTLRGSSFGTDATKLVVNFGAQRGTIESVTDQVLQVHIPSGATYNNISVANTTNGLT